MKVVIAVFLATFLAQIFVRKCCACILLSTISNFVILFFKAIPTDFIENGKPATDKLHAVIILSIARIGDQRAAFGGGAIISPRHILTAAHLCIK